MEITILGCGGGVPRPGGALCGQLVSHGERRIWVDAGSGTLGVLLRYAGIADIDTVVISHRHFDHFLDLYPFAYAREKLAETQPGTPRFRLIGPPDFLAHAERLTGPGGLDDVLDWTPLELGGSTPIGDVTLDTASMRHGVPTLGMRFTAGGRTIAYSADTGPCDALVDIGRDADVLVCEATYGAGEPGEPMHLSARQAGEHAERAGARSLVLTHTWYQHDLDEVVAAARAVYGGDVAAATAGETIRG
jgi:ribonuclease BN (tRNA processing enzyme)